MVKYDEFTSLNTNSFRVKKVKELIMKIKETLEENPTNDIKKFYNEVVLTDDGLPTIDYYFDERMTKVFSLFNMLLLQRKPDLLKGLDKIYFGFFWDTPRRSNWYTKKYKIYRRMCFYWLY